MKKNTTSANKENSEPNKRGRIASFLLNHKVSVFLVLVILGVFSWGTFKNYQLKSQFEENKIKLETQYAQKTDSLQVANYKLTTKVFSWAIRSELMRNNNEQINQFFLSFIQNPNIEKVQLVNPDNAVILLSTDKKDEGMKMDMTQINQTDSLMVVREASVLKIYNPIMGLNKKIGILVVAISSQKPLENK